MRTTTAPHRPGRARLLAVLLLLAGLAAAATSGAPAASAHDVLVKTSPADGSTVPRVPDKVVLTFDQPALAVGTELKITGPSGDVQQGKPVLVDNTVSQAIAPGSPAGDYTVLWRVTSDDGHPVSGTFTFTAAHGSGTTASGPPTPTATPTGTASPTAPTTTTPATGSSGSTPPASTTSRPADQADSGGSSAPWIAAGIVLLLLIGGLVVWTRRGE